MPEPAAEVKHVVATAHRELLEHPLRNRLDHRTGVSAVQPRKRRLGITRSAALKIPVQPAHEFAPTTLHPWQRRERISVTTRWSEPILSAPRAQRRGLPVPASSPNLVLLDGSEPLVPVD